MKLGDGSARAARGGIIRGHAFFTTAPPGAPFGTGLSSRKVNTINAPRVIPSSQHPISPANISANALAVLKGLKQAGYESHLVGGCVRDLMLGREPKDYDVVTDARPEEIRKLFRRARLIGRRFRLAHVYFGREYIEVATFRASPPEAEAPDGEWDEDEPFDLDEDDVEEVGPERGSHAAPPSEHADQNIFGTQEEDALRRDFTVNALYYNIRDGAVIDYVGGATDLERGVLRTIGDPETRYREDAVRMLRAIRFAGKLAFRLDADTAAPIRTLAPLLLDVSPARLFEEVLKLFQGGYAVETYELLRQYGLFKFLFPLTEASLERQQGGYPMTFLARALANTDKRVGAGLPVTPAFLFAALLWEPLRIEAQRLTAEGESLVPAWQRASERVLRDQLKHITVPRRFSVPMREIWDMQLKFARRGGKRAFRLFEHPRFRAAYDFLCLRAQEGEEDPALCEWWTRFQEVDASERDAMIAALGGSEGGGGRRRRRRRGGSARAARA